MRQNMFGILDLNNHPVKVFVNVFFFTNQLQKNNWTTIKVRAFIYKQIKKLFVKLTFSKTKKIFQREFDRLGFVSH